MANNFMYWHDLRGKPVNIAGQGRQYGVIEDFYYDPETQAVDALRVHTHLGGYHILLSSAVRSIERDGVTVANEHMLIAEDNAGPIYQLPLGNRLIGFRVATEQDRELGLVRSILLGISPPVALRIAALELQGARRSSISAHEIIRFGDGEVFVIEQEGKGVS